MTVKVALGCNFNSDLDFLENSSDLEITCLYDHDFDQQFDMEPDKYYKMLSNMDLVIFKDDAHSMRQRFAKHSALKSFQEFFLSPTVKKVWCTMDSHHLWMHELPFQRYLDRIYIAHSQFMNKFDSSKVRWLPGYFEQCNIRTLLEIAAHKFKPAFDVGMVYGNYSYIGDRNLPIWQIRQILEKRKLSYYFGTVKRGLRYIYLMKSCRVGLSVSLAGNNVDQRFFEVLGLGGTFLGDKVIDHDKIELNLSHAHFFQHNLTDFEVALEAAYLGSGG